MPLKDTAARAAVLKTLHKAIGDELKAVKDDLEDQMRKAKADTGTEKVSITLDDDTKIGTATFVQPTPTAKIIDEDKFLAWVIENYKDEIQRRFITEARPAFVKQILDHITAAGATEWADPTTGELHHVPGIGFAERAEYALMKIPADGLAAIGQAWADGKLAHMVLPQITAGEDQ